MNIKIIISVIIVSALITGTGYYIINNQNKNNNNNKSDIGQNDKKIIFQTREITTMVNDNEFNYVTNIYAFNVDGKSKKIIYSIPENASVKQSPNQMFTVFNGSDSYNKVKVVDTQGRVNKIFNLPEHSQNFVLSSDGESYAYEVMEISGDNTSSIGKLVVVLKDGSNKEFKAEYFVSKMNPNFSQVLPLNFSKDGSKLIVNVFPTAQGGDITDPHGYFILELTNWQASEITFSGSKELDFKLTESEPSIHQFTLFPFTDKAVISTTINPEESLLVQILDLTDFQTKAMFTLGNQGEYKNFSLIENSISQNENTLLLSKGYNLGLAVYNISESKIDKNMNFSGTPIGWLDDDHVIYKELRNKTWDDQQYSLKVIKLNTNEKSEIFTQLTDHVEGAGISQVGDVFYQFVGVVDK